MPTPKKSGASANQTPTPPQTSPSPPKPGAPVPPAGFVPLDQAASRALMKPTPTQVAGGSAVAAEIEGASTYAADFTTSAPAAADLAAKLRNAEAWTFEADNAHLWHQYASAQKQIAWDAVAQETQALQTEYEYALQHDPMVETRYPELTRFLRARKAVAARAVQTKNAKKRVPAATPAAPPPAGGTGTGKT